MTNSPNKSAWLSAETFAKASSSSAKRGAPRGPCGESSRSSHDDANAANNAK